MIRFLFRLAIVSWLVDHEDNRITQWYGRRNGIPVAIRGEIVEGK